MPQRRRVVCGCTSRSRFCLLQMPRGGSPDAMTATTEHHHNTLGIDAHGLHSAALRGPLGRPALAGGPGAQRRRYRLVAMGRPLGQTRCARGRLMGLRYLLLLLARRVVEARRSRSSARRRGCQQEALGSQTPRFRTPPMGRSHAATLRRCHGTRMPVASPRARRRCLAVSRNNIRCSHSGNDTCGGSSTGQLHDERNRREDATSTACESR